MNITTKNNIQVGCLPIALFTNCSLIFLICTKSPIELGTYKYLMIFFSVVSASYSVIDAFLSPLLISFEDCFIVLSKIQLPDPNFQRIFLCYGCGFCGVVMSMFVIHFIYRYFAIERRGNLKYFSKWYFLCWLLIPIGTGFLWAETVSRFLGEDDKFSNYTSDLLLEDYDVNISDFVYVGVQYWKGRDNGEKYLNWKGVEGVCILGTIMTVCFVFIVIYGTLTSQKIKLLVLQGRSEFTKRLQKQLYYALVIQTIIPVFFMITPLSIYFFSPYFQVGHQFFADLTTICIVIYPIIDPLPVIFVVDNYRNAVFKLFGVSREEVEVYVNSIS